MRWTGTAPAVGWDTEGAGGVDVGPNRPDCRPTLSSRSDRPLLTEAPALQYSLPRIYSATFGYEKVYVSESVCVHMRVNVCIIQVVCSAIMAANVTVDLQEYTFPRHGVEGIHCMS